MPHVSFLRRGFLGQYDLSVQRYREIPEAVQKDLILTAFPLHKHPNPTSQKRDVGHPTLYNKIQGSFTAFRMTACGSGEIA